MRSFAIHILLVSSSLCFGASDVTGAILERPFNFDAQFAVTKEITTHKEMKEAKKSEKRGSAFYAKVVRKEIRERGKEQLRDERTVNGILKNRLPKIK